MSSSLNSVIFYFLFTALAICLTHARESPSPPRFKYDVHIINGCENQKFPLIPINGSCVDENKHPIGTFSLRRFTDEFHWSVKINPRGHSTYVCHLRRADTKAGIVAFDQHRDDKDRRCKKTGMCWWKVDEIGIYFSNQNYNYSKYYDWEKSNVIGS
ncbi:hypothetical protein JCGZ_19214 [Jatropha curcas]|uniref:Uncharacterized protein n=1 Tax=Jatropha curcas TaxID=180498 RepID=A0A067L7G9_JATCU|nr:hypothetical protein JCGZ_19214 [Jatropha curcas]